MTEPVAAFSEPSLTPFIATAITFVAAVTEPVGVNVAVQVLPLSALVTVDSVPLGTVRLLLLNPVTLSENVKVTKDVVPIRRAVVATTAERVGGVMSVGI